MEIYDLSFSGHEYSELPAPIDTCGTKGFILIIASI